MTNVERIKYAMRETSRYGVEEEIQRLTIENAVSLAAIADALEELTEHTRCQKDAVESINGNMAGGRISDSQEW